MYHCVKYHFTENLNGMKEIEGGVEVAIVATQIVIDIEVIFFHIITEFQIVNVYSFFNRTQRQ